ncbi:hypothetical protein BU24DRAFT_423422 [Aaosphaeria arxii CBS 175.79]|uniref:Uncharacterized protein n=1 Tax=Aaosphaeria arxii CBS 175.79 TaxID=1450172 RepID=A0A6A5XML8_9PLEO|nr:uncharacterized protein BU24DRAFT_423422 [Aaosphaeria arxii CBS 175.79]KAF2014488.1 hypothetical protein BU24DRAFT_423422 [Aaosphaeria arxii CBS 175.79]
MASTFIVGKVYCTTSPDHTPDDDCSMCPTSSPCDVYHGNNVLIEHNPYSPLVDGDKVWYCSSCNEGPIGSWQNVCAICGHQKCSNCKEEESK